jgi:hypothetical protein
MSSVAGYLRRICASAEWNLFPEPIVLRHHQRRGMALTAIYIVAMVIGCSSILGYLASRSTGQVMQIRQPSATQIAALREAGVTPICGCAEASIAFGQFTNISFVQDGLCEWASLALATCPTLNGACDRDYIQYTSAAGLGSYMRAGVGMCGLASAATSTAISSFLVSHFPTPNLLTEAAMELILNQTVAALRQNIETTFVGSINAVRAVGTISRPVLWSQLDVSLTLAATGPSADAAIAAAYVDVAGDAGFVVARANATTLSGLGLNDSIVGVLAPVWGPTVNAINEYRRAEAVALGLDAPLCSCASNPECSIPQTQEPFASYGMSIFCDGFDTAASMPSALALDPIALELLGMPASTATLVPASHFAYPVIYIAFENAFIRLWQYDVDYADYYAKCSPISCQWIQDSTPTVVEAVSISAGVLGGFSVVLKFAVNVLGWCIFKSSTCRRLIGEEILPNGADCAKEPDPRSAGQAVELSSCHPIDVSALGRVSASDATHAP